jgi:hypothetical protein
MTMGMNGVQAVRWKILNSCLKFPQNVGRCLEECRASHPIIFLNQNSQFLEFGPTAALQKMETGLFTLPIQLEWFMEEKKTFLTFQVLHFLQQEAVKTQKK